MMLIELGELGPPQLLSLSHEQGTRLARSGVVTARPSAFTPHLWELSAAGKVGAARVGDIEVHITPKVGVTRLLFLAGYARSGVKWTNDVVSIGQADDLVAAIGQALWRQLDRALHQGLLPGYVVLEETSPVLRGRLLESATAQPALRPGVPIGDAPRRVHGRHRREPDLAYRLRADAHRAAG